MAVLPLAAEQSATVALIVAVLALVGAIAAAAISVLGLQREREANYQDKKRALFAQLLALLEAKQSFEEASAEEGEAYLLLLQNVRQVAEPGGLRKVVDQELGRGFPPAQVTQQKIDHLEAWMDYEKRLWLFRHLPVLRMFGRPRS
jgi:Tfp pilus assembly protein PilX